MTPCVTRRRLLIAALTALAGAFAVAVLLGSGARPAPGGHPERLEPPPAPFRGRHWIVHLPAELARVHPPAAWAEAADRRLEGMAARLGLALPAEPLQQFLYASVEAKEAAAGDDGPFTAEPAQRAVHVLVTPEGEIPDPRGEALLLLRLAWGEPGADGGERAVSRCAAGEFHGFPLAGYAARIAREEEPYPLRDVLRMTADDGAALSPLVTDALAGAWAEGLRESRGAAVLRQLWSAPFSPGNEEELARALGAASWSEIEAAWQRWLAARPALPPDPPRPRRLAFLRGISFSHEMRGEGYGSDRGDEQLARMKALGANAVAIVPYAFTRAPEQPVVRYRGTDESDERLARTFSAARRLGLSTLLKPQLWDPGHFTGDVVLASDADFARWFAGYRRYLLHQARLAALERADLLVIGTELGGLTRRQEAWRGLIRDVRRVYPGPLTYAANWAEDFEALPFWDALDLLGLNMYYPLAAPGETPSAGSPRVRALRDKLAVQSRRWGKPVLFTEVGYAASAAAAAEPWKERNAAPDPEMQARCYRVVFEAFYREPWLAGMFWWKWPSHGRGRADDESFNPLGKPALQVLATFYGPGRRRN